MDNPNTEEILRRLFISRDDFAEAYGYTKYMLEGGIFDMRDETSKWTKKAYELSIVVSYIRPFTYNMPKEHSLHKLFKDFVESEFSDKEKELHYKILNLRHKVYAHSDAEPRAVRLAMSEVFGCSAISNGVFHNLTEDDVKLLSNLLIRLLHFVAKEAHKHEMTLSDGTYQPHI